MPHLRSLGLDTARDALMYAPSGYQPSAPVPLVLSLHGAGGDAQGGLYPLQPLADDAGFSCWRCPRAGAPGMPSWAHSDRTRYALCLGLANGDLFGHVMAFSPGFVAPAPSRGQPRVFVSHGTADAVLPIHQCSRRIVPRLRQASYDVMYEEFEGPHTVPPDIAESAANWFLANRVVAEPNPDSPRL